MEGRISTNRECTSHDEHLHGETQQNLVPSLRPLAPSVNQLTSHQILYTQMREEGEEREKGEEGKERRGRKRCPYFWFMKNCNL